MANKFKVEDKVYLVDNTGALDVPKGVKGTIKTIRSFDGIEHCNVEWDTGTVGTRNRSGSNWKLSRFKIASWKERFK